MVYGTVPLLVERYPFVSVQKVSPTMRPWSLALSASLSLSCALHCANADEAPTNKFFRAQPGASVQRLSITASVLRDISNIGATARDQWHPLTRNNLQGLRSADSIFSEYQYRVQRDQNDARQYGAAGWLLQGAVVVGGALVPAGEPSLSNETEKLSLRAGDLLVVPDKVVGYLFAGYLIRVRLDVTKVLPDFVALAFEEPVTRAAIERFAKSTSGVHNINSEQIKSLQWPLPSMAEQGEIIRCVRHAFSKMDLLTTETTRAKSILERVDQAILAKAFAGELVLRNCSADKPPMHDVA
jgi:hypothetical protein